METKTGVRNEARFEAAGSAYEEHLGGVPCDEFTGDGQCRDNVAAGAAAGDEYAQVCQA